MAATECFAHGLKEELQSARVFYIRLFQKPIGKTDAKGGRRYAADRQRQTVHPGRGASLPARRSGGHRWRHRPRGRVPGRHEGQVPGCGICGRPGADHSAGPHQCPHPHLQRPGPGPGHHGQSPHQLPGGAGGHLVEHRPPSDPGRHPGLRLRHGAGLHPGRRDHHLRPPRLLPGDSRFPVRHPGCVSGGGHPGQPVLRGQRAGRHGEVQRGHPGERRLCQMVQGAGRRHDPRHVRRPRPVHPLGPDL